MTENAVATEFGRMPSNWPIFRGRICVQADRNAANVIEDITKLLDDAATPLLAEDAVRWKTQS